MPEAFVEQYKPGTWVKAGFLHTFTFLALSFLLVNPPFGDVTAASLDGDWDIGVMDGDGTLVLASASDNATDDGGEGFAWTTDDGILRGSAWVMFTLTDNDEVSANEVEVRLSRNAGSETVEPVEVVPDAFANLSRSDAITAGSGAAGRRLGRGPVDHHRRHRGAGLSVVNTRVYAWHLDVIDERA